ncbi:MAG: Hydrogenase-1 large chain [Acidobacteria bacterium]|nr:Hydrogenase-1 large chain [Acidobacteriota bacterium]
MYFKNLPIEFDASGQATLRGDGQSYPFAMRGGVGVAEPDVQRVIAGLAERSYLRSFDIDPVTRVSGALAFHTVIDFEQRKALDARTGAALFRGYELILKDREPSDTVQIASRVCGLCSGANTIASALALEMAYNVAPPPLAIIARNLGASAESLFDHPQHLFLHAGPDYSEVTIRKTAPSLWEKALVASAPNAGAHGFGSIAQIMAAMNPMAGDLYLEAMHVTRAAREIATAIFGKYPHPSTMFPGGIGIVPERETFNRVLGRIHLLVEYSKKVALIWDDLVEFFYDANPLYRKVGELPANLLSMGMWDDAESYDGSYQNCNSWGERRLSTPGAVVNGELRTTRLTELNIGIEEFIPHSFYKQWEGSRLKSDPHGSPLSPFHPWNKKTIPDPSERNWKERYSWGTSPRWDCEPMETGPLARMWVSALAGKLKSEFIHATGNGLEMELPKLELPAQRLRWRIPEKPNALERNRARAYQIAYSSLMAFTFMLKAFEYLHKGEKKMSKPFRSPVEAAGVGFWEGVRGAMTHHVAIEYGSVADYQILSASTWTASPRDPFGVPGPCESAVMNTPLLEESAKPEEFMGIDILRTIRSFDPCLHCAVH